MRLVLLSDGQSSYFPNADWLLLASFFLFFFVCACVCLILFQRRRNVFVDKHNCHLLLSQSCLFIFLFFFIFGGGRERRIKEDHISKREYSKEKKREEGSTYIHTRALTYWSSLGFGRSVWCVCASVDVWMLFRCIVGFLFISLGGRGEKGKEGRRKRSKRGWCPLLKLWGIERRSNLNRKKERMRKES